jgi:predicted acylesterase/phospholipase RssA
VSFDSVVFAGGGNRCFWQAGFWHTYTKERALFPKTVASVSAGAAISNSLFSGNFDKVLENTLSVQEKNEKNRYWKNLVGSEAIHPHSKLYREIIYQSIDEAGMQSIINGPLNRMLVAHIPRWLGPRSAAIVGLSAYQLEKKLTQRVHPVFGRKLGFRSEFIETSTLKTVEQLADAILSSSCTPPFTPLMFRENKPVLDGGMVDNVPVHGIEAENTNTLVLLSRPYKQLPEIAGRTYVQPLKPVPVSSWDYTNPQAVLATYEQGKQDAYVYLKLLNRM